MNTTLEQAIEVASSLPIEEQRRLREWLEKQEKQKVEDNNLQEEEARFQRSMEWLKANRVKYIGEWVALDGDRLVSHGKDAVKVRLEAKAAGVQIPLMERITENDLLPFGGW